MPFVIFAPVTGTRETMPLACWFRYSKAAPERTKIAKAIAAYKRILDRRYAAEAGEWRLSGTRVLSSSLFKKIFSARFDWAFFKASEIMLISDSGKSYVAL
ncbi:MAG: hypothetical protein KKG95_01360 [Candidatus Omnitrophica bacterium]|nr:hypothetical protein [Candidatus Omnitrophota bacterium]